MQSLIGCFSEIRAHRPLVVYAASFPNSECNLFNTQLALIYESSTGIHVYTTHTNLRQLGAELVQLLLERSPALLLVTEMYLDFT